MSDLNLVAYGPNGDSINLPIVSRVEVITNMGRECVIVLDKPGAYAQVQDDGRTLKIFVNE